MPTSSTAVAGRASVAASGSQVCTGHIGALTAKAMKNPTNSQRSAVGRRVEVAGEVGDEEAVVATGACDVDPDDGHEHDQAAREGEQQELHRGVLPAWAAEQPDEEVHRDQHRLEEDVEQEHVGGGEDADDERLEHQHQREVALLAAGALVADVVPRGEQADRGEDGRHHDERQRDAVDTQGVGDPELRDPRVHLGELELLDGVGVEPHPREHRQHQRHEREAQGHRLRVARPRSRAARRRRRRRAAAPPSSR